MGCANVKIRMLYPCGCRFYRRLIDASVLLSPMEFRTPIALWSKVAHLSLKQFGDRASRSGAANNQNNTHCPVVYYSRTLVSETRRYGAKPCGATNSKSIVSRREHNKPLRLIESRVLYGPFVQQLGHLPD